jgi:hypothetical protein
MLPFGLYSVYSELSVVKRAFFNYGKLGTHGISFNLAICLGKVIEPRLA